MDNFWFISGAVFAGLGVALGAFGAHALKARLTPERLETFETGVRYQMYHAFGLLVAGLALRSGMPAGWLAAAGGLFLAGILLFSGSLYLLVLSERRWLGAITPLGGVSFILGWLCLLAAASST